MTVATALVEANDASPAMVEEAVAEALARAGLARANCVLLFMTSEFRKIAAQGVRIAGKTASCLQVGGSIVAGLANERRWVFDRPAVGVLVLGGRFGIDPQTGGPDASGALELALAGTHSFPPNWSADVAVHHEFMLGSQYSDPMLDAPLPVWQNGRLLPECHTRLHLSGIDARIGCSAGVRLLGAAKIVDVSSGFDLQCIAGHDAVESLGRDIPAALHGPESATTLPLHQLCIAVIDANDAANHPPRLLPLMSVNGDGSVTVGDRLLPGQRVQWAIRQPLHSEADMRTVTGKLLASGPTPAFAFYASCIGRGPYFYGGEDRDWHVIREQMPEIPLLGIYGSGQMMPVATRCRPMQNSCVLALANARQET